MEVKFYIDRWVFPGVWKRVSTGVNSLGVAENLKQSLAERQNESEENYSVVVTTAG